MLIELQRRATQALERDVRQEAAGALLILDNVSDPALLSPPQLASLPRAPWLRVVATTRFGPEQLRASQKSLGFVRVDSLNEDDALALVRDHQKPRDAKGLFPGFDSPCEEQSAREIVRELGCFTLAVEQVAVYLGLHEEVTPAAYLSGMRRKGLHIVDALGGREDIQNQMLHREKQLSIILETTLGLLDEPGRTALRFASLLPPDSVPWPWLKTLVLRSHPELARFAADEPDPWLAIRRRVAGLRLLTDGDDPAIARIHRLVASHIQNNSGDALFADQPLAKKLESILTERAWAIHDTQAPPDLWELDALLLTLPPMLSATVASHDLAKATVFLTDEAITYRHLPAAKQLLDASLRVLQQHSAADVSNAEWQRDLGVSYQRIGNVLLAKAI